MLRALLEFMSASRARAESLTFAGNARMRRDDGFARIRYNLCAVLYFVARSLRFQIDKPRGFARAFVRVFCQRKYDDVNRKRRQHNRFVDGDDNTDNRTKAFSKIICARVRTNARHLHLKGI